MPTVTLTADQAHATIEALTYRRDTCRRDAEALWPSSAAHKRAVTRVAQAQDTLRIFVQATGPEERAA